MKKTITIAIFLISIIINNNLFSQTDKYEWTFKLGWGLSTFVNYGETKDWVETGKGNELLLGSLGYKNINLNLSYKYFNGLKSNNEISFNGYIFPNTVDYRKVFMNLTLSYEYELVKRLYIDPQIGWVRTHITSNAIDNQGNDIELNKADGIVFGSNLTKYFKVYNKAYLGIYFNINYNIIDYQNISQDLDGNTLIWGFGFLIRGTN